MTNISKRNPYRAGDRVYHKPTDEKWLLLADEESGMVIPGGWPDVTGKGDDCTPLKFAHDGERLTMLHSVVNSAHPARDIAKRQLEAAAKDPGPRVDGETRSTLPDGYPVDRLADTSNFKKVTR